MRAPVQTTRYAMLLLCALSVDVAAQSHRVFVNGERMNDAQVAQLARVSCTAIPDGAYWLSTRTGAWGYMGNPQVQGVVGDACRRDGADTGGINRDGTIGPFATMARAQQVANDYRQRGMNAIAFHNGDGYYVRASR